MPSLTFSMSVRRARETKIDSSLSVLVHRERCASKSPDACPWQVDCARMTVQVESEIREKVRELYGRTGEIAA